MCLIVCSARYFRHYWRRSIYIHATVGILIFVISTVAVFMAWSRNLNTVGHFVSFSKWASLFENVATYLIWILCVSGMIAWFYRRYGNYEWGTTKVLAIGKFHKYFGQVLCFGIQGLVMFAIIDNFGFTPEWITIAVLQFVVHAAVFACLEWRH